MSTFDRQSQGAYSVAGARAEAGIDQGLRAYMLGVYNYMTFGLALTGFFAHRHLHDVGCHQRRRRHCWPDTAGLRHLRQPAEMGCHAGSARNGNVAVLPHPVHERVCCPDHVPGLFGHDGHLAVLDLHGLHRRIDRARVLHHGSFFRCAEPLRLHHEERPVRLGARSCSWA